MSEFKREERYIVVKLKHLAGLQVAPLRNFLRENRVPTLDCVVVEKDWPEYEKVWRSIERRMTGQPAEDFDRVTAERDAALAELGRYHSLFNQAQKAIDRLNELHRKRMAEIGRRLTAADERLDVLEGLVGEVLDAVGREPLDLDAVLRMRARMRAALKPAEGGGDAK